MGDKSDSGPVPWRTPAGQETPISDSPYRVPEGGFDEQRAPRTFNGPPADRYRRALNLLFDLLASYGLMLVSLFTLWVFGLFSATGTQTLVESIPDWLMWLVFLFFYYLLCEALWGRTIAKLITGTRVVTVDGRPPDAGRIFLRTLVRFVPFEFVSFLLPGYADAGWHDRASGTRVVRID